MRRVATRATTSRCAGSGTRSAIATEKPTPAESPSEHTSPSTPASDSSSSQDRHAISSATSTTSRPANAAKRRYRSTIRFRSFSSDSNRAAVENSSCGAAPEIATNSHMSRSRSNKRRTEPVGGRRDQLVERRQQLHRKRRDHPPSTSRRQHFLEAHSLVCEDALLPVYLRDQGGKIFGEVVRFSCIDRRRFDHRGNGSEWNAGGGEPTNAHQPDQIGKFVSSVTVGQSSRLGQQPQSVIVPNGPRSGACRTGHVADSHTNSINYDATS